MSKQLTNEQIKARGEKIWSSGVPDWWEDKDFDLIRAYEYRCASCGGSIFTFSDFPEIKNGELLCESCDYDKNWEYCPLCEESYEKEDDSDVPFPKSPFYYSADPEEYYNYKQEKDIIAVQGIYEATGWPVFSSAMGLSTSMYWNNVRLICTKEEWLKEHPEDKGFWEEEGAEFICGDCWEKAKSIKEKNKQ